MIEENSSLSALRVLKSIIDKRERILFLLLLKDTDFVAKDIEESIELWLEYNNDPEYSELFFRIHDTIKQYFTDNKVITLGMLPTVTRTTNNGEEIPIRLNTNELFFDSVLMNACPNMSESLFDELFPSVTKIIHEPNGRNECPDLQLIFSDGSSSYVEVKSVLCSFFDDGTFKGKINNAMKGIDLILADMRLESVKENKCNTNLRNITTVFFFYFVNASTMEADYFKAFVVPAPLCIDCEFNTDGTFYKLGQKSDNNFNTVLNLKIRSPFNRDNTLFDRALLISGLYTSKGLNHLISNKEGEFYRKMELFELYKNKLENAILCNFDITEVLSIMDELKASKYNSNTYACKYDKDYIKEIISKFKKLIKQQYGKKSIR